MRSGVIGWGTHAINADPIEQIFTRNGFTGTVSISIPDSIERIQSIVRNHAESAISHLHDHGSYYVLNPDDDDWEDLRKDVWNKYSGILDKHFLDHFMNAARKDTVLRNMLSKWHSPPSKREGQQPIIELANVIQLADLHWYDFLVEVRCTGIEFDKVRNWDVSQGLPVFAKFELIHLILLSHSDSETLQSWVNVFECANDLLSDWKQYLTPAKQYLTPAKRKALDRDNRDEMMQTMLEMLDAETIFSANFGSFGKCIVMNRETHRPANLRYIWNQIFGEPPRKFSDLFNQPPTDSIRLWRTGENGFHCEEVPSSDLEKIIWRSFDYSFVRKKTHSSAVVSNFIEHRFKH